MNILIALVAVAGIIWLLVSCSQPKPVAPAADIPPPTSLRTDLLYAYYGSDMVQYEETKDHVNAHMVMNWGGNEIQLQRMITARQTGIKLFVEFPQALQGENETRMRFNTFRENGLLEHITLWFLVDEPDRTNYSEKELEKANQRLRTIGAEYGVLVKTAVIYSSHSNTPAIGSYDYAGFDNYDDGDRIFTNGKWMEFKRKLRGDQKAILVPGGCDKWRNEPEQFFNVAQRDTQVGLLMPFIWLDNADPANGAGLGIRSNGMRLKYWNTGMKISFPS